MCRMMKKCVVIGAGGHSRSLCSVLLASDEFDPVMVIDLEFSGEKEDILGIRVGGLLEGLCEDLNNMGIENAFVAAGDNAMRKELFMELKESKFLLPNLIAKTAIIKQEVHLGQGNVIFDNAYVGPLSRIGDNNIINTGSVVEHECVIGSHCNIGPLAVVSGRCTLENNIYMGSSCTIIDGIGICSHVTLGAGAVVVKDLKSPGIYIGIPAERIKNP